jgi:hypothetical protein
VLVVAVCTREPPECEALDVAPDDLAQVRVSVAAFVRLLADLARVRGAARRGVAAGAAREDIVRLGRLSGDAACDVFFVARPDAGALAAFLASREKAKAPARVLVPTARRLPAKLASRGEIVVLEEALVMKGARLVLQGVRPATSLGVVRAAAEDAASSDADVSMPRAARWRDVRFGRIDQLTVLVRVGEQTARRTCQDFGMAHDNTREPLKPWLLFMEFLEGHGTYKGRGFGSTDVTKRLVSTLRAALKRAFHIEEKPIDDYVSKVGWAARFRVED